ncbi:MAG: hypothetical protein M3M94_02725 [Actinomycetota bacterium]|nr:hypothetical protein [Actinomycetota bacterium]
MADGPGVRRGTRVRRVVAGLGLVSAAVLLAAWVILDLAFEYPSDADERLEELARDQGRAVAVALVFAFGQIALVPAILGIVHLARDRAFWLAHVGGLLGLVGVCGHLVFSGTGLATIEVAERAGSAEAVALYEDVTNNAALVPFLAMGLLGTLAGLVLLALALWRSRVAPVWIAASIAAGVVLEFAGSSFVELLSLLGGLLVSAGFFALGVLVLRMSDSEWGGRIAA